MFRDWSRRDIDRRCHAPMVCITADDEAFAHVCLPHLLGVLMHSSSFIMLSCSFQRNSTSSTMRPAASQRFECTICHNRFPSYHNRSTVSCSFGTSLVVSASRRRASFGRTLPGGMMSWDNCFPPSHRRYYTYVRARDVTPVAMSRACARRLT